MLTRQQLTLAVIDAGGSALAMHTTLVLSTLAVRQKILPYQCVVSSSLYPATNGCDPSAPPTLAYVPGARTEVDESLETKWFQQLAGTELVVPSAPGPTGFLMKTPGEPQPTGKP